MGSCVHGNGVTVYLCVQNKANADRRHTEDTWFTSEQLRNGHRIEFLRQRRSFSSYSPADGKLIGTITTTTREEYDRVIATAQSAYLTWRTMPAPKRGEIVRQYGDKLRAKKRELGQLVSYEMGKSLQEGLGEVQEMIDICDFAKDMAVN